MKYFIINCKKKISITISLFSLLFFAGNNVSGQIKVAGRVTDKYDVPLQNVSAVIKSNEKKVHIQADGKFTLEVEMPDSLIVKKEGYSTETITLNPDVHSIKIQLRRIEKFDEILRLPFNLQISKRFYTGAVEGITGNEMAKFHTSNTANTLEGRIPGLLAVQGTDEPGYAATQLYIRGQSSYNNNAVSSYVDNVPSTAIGSLVFADLDPLEIDQVQVLKDGVANGVYGIRGGNKSLFLTTKRGKAFERHLDIYSSFGFEEPVALPSFANAQKYMTWYNEARQNDGLPAVYQQSQIEAFNGTHDPYLYPDVDWYAANLNKSTALQKYTVTLSGGNNVMRYFVLGGLNTEAGLYKNGNANFAQYGYKTNQQFNRYNLRSNFDFTINKNLTAYIDLSARMKDITNPGTSESPASNLFSLMSTYPPNLFPFTFQNGGIGGNAQYPNNPYGLITRKGNFTSSTRVTFGNIGFTQKLDMLLKGLSASGAYVFYNAFYNYQGFFTGTPSFTVYQMSNGVLQSFGKDVLPTYAIQTGSQQRINSFIGKLNYKTKWNEENELTSVFGYSQDKKTLSAQGYNFPYITPNFFNQTHYQYKSRYLLDANFSYSGSEIFPPDHRFGFFPSVGAGWILSEEDFLKKAPFISFLKIRASYAVLGNSNLTNATGLGRFIYSSQYLINQPGATFGVTPATPVTVAEGAIVNSNVTWERQKMFNVGIDASFLSNTLGFTVDVFNERRTHILATPGNITGLIGQTISPLNTGIVNNKGIESNIWYANHVGGFNYKITFNASVNKNKIIYMSEAGQPYPYLYKTGNPIGSIFGLQALGLFQSTTEIATSPTQLFSVVQPGDIKYKDQNGDGIIDANDIVKLGDPSIPTTYFGSSIELSYKGITLNATFQGATNYTIDLRTYATEGFYGGARPSDLMEGRWTSATSATATYPRFSFGAANNYQLSSFWLKNISYLRLKNIELGYNLPVNMLDQIKIKGARIYVSGFNLLTWSNTGIDYIDPEAPSLGITDYPRLRNITFGLDINL